MPKIKVRVVDCYIFSQTGNDIYYLLLKRNKNRIYEHLWQGVAGKMEVGETAWQTAKRELNEETGLEPIRMFAADHVSRFYEAHSDVINLVPVFGIEVNTSKITLSKEHCEFRWVGIDIAVQMLSWNGQKEGITVVCNMLNSDDDRIRWSKI